MTNLFNCPVCKKSLTESEYAKALGLWEKQREHIQHLKDANKKQKEKEKSIQASLEKEKKKLQQQQINFKEQVRQRENNFKKEQKKLLVETKKKLREQSQKNDLQLKTQRLKLEKNFQEKKKNEINKGIEEGVKDVKKNLKKKESDLKKTTNKMNQLENSLNVSAQKYEQANGEIKKLKKQIEKGITPQIEGLLEETKLLTKLKELFPKDRFEHPGKGGDIIQYVRIQEKEIGKILYECKKVKTFNKSHIEQTKKAQRLREADFAILVTNCFPSKKQYYFVEKTVFVISPANLEPITYTLRESLIKIALLKITNEAKQKAVQKVYEYLSSTDYNNKMQDIAIQFNDLEKEIKAEIKSHKKCWGKRAFIYNSLYSDIGLIDYKLKGLAHDNFNKKTKILPPQKKKLIEIE